jgi:NAD+ synthase (glutamine-hydrolysing)
MALGGANVILNLSASDEVIGKHQYLVNLITHQSAACRATYVYASSGIGESSTDLVFTGNAIIAENGSILSESPLFTGSEVSVIADTDIDILNKERQNYATFGEKVSNSFRIITINNTGTAHRNSELLRNVNPMPFVPAEDTKLNERCQEIISIQAAGLMQRLRFTGCKKIVVGISGGLDSTLALLVAVKAFDNLKLDRKGIFGITMPGFGTTHRTHNNATDMMALLGVTSLEIPIGESVNLHFKDINHDSSIHDITYENCQARERTQILMDYSNKIGGMVIGTGDLSELALGWCTYNGDHMSMYAVNASIPKTLVKHLVNWFASTTTSIQLRDALIDIINTPISPELLPADENGDIAQKTEDLVGPYELHDFFLYNTIRHCFTPAKVYMLAKHAFANTYTDKTILHWLKTFYRRFFNQQFKRSCMPDGPKVGSICLSPRGDWRMPSDASARLWLSELDNL